jgi:hypothetical protein
MSSRRSAQNASFFASARLCQSFWPLGLTVQLGLILRRRHWQGRGRVRSELCANRFAGHARHMWTLWPLTEGSGNVKFVLVAALLNLHLFALSRISHVVQMIV